MDGHKECWIYVSIFSNLKYSHVFNDIKFSYFFLYVNKKNINI